MLTQAYPVDLDHFDSLYDHRTAFPRARALGSGRASLDHAVKLTCGNSSFLQPCRSYGRHFQSVQPLAKFILPLWADPDGTVNVQAKKKALAARAKAQAKRDAEKSEKKP